MYISALCHYLCYSLFFISFNSFAFVVDFHCSFIVFHSISVSSSIGPLLRQKKRWWRGKCRFSVHILRKPYKFHFCFSARLRFSLCLFFILYFPQPLRQALHTNKQTIQPQGIKEKTSANAEADNTICYNRAMLGEHIPLLK